MKCLCFIASFVTLTVAFGDGHLGISEEEEVPIDSSSDGGGFILQTPIHSPGGASRKNDGGGKKIALKVYDFPKSELRYVLYASENEKLAKEMIASYKKNQDIFLAPVNPLTREVFSKVVKNSRRNYLDHIWPNPARISVVVVSPNFLPNGRIASDEKTPWELHSLFDREQEILEAFRHRVSLPVWGLLSPVPEDWRCQLQINEVVGLTAPLDKRRKRDILEIFDAHLSSFSRAVIQRQILSIHSDLPELYGCR